MEKQSADPESHLPFHILPTKKDRYSHNSQTLARPNDDTGLAPKVLTIYIFVGCLLSNYWVRKIATR
jgi:hypothetical protein